MNVNLSKAPGPVREFEGARGVAGRYEKGRCNGPEAGVRLECSRSRKAASLLEPEREGRGLQGKKPKRKQGRQTWQGLVSY